MPRKISGTETQSLRFTEAEMKAIKQKMLDNDIKTFQRIGHQLLVSWANGPAFAQSITRKEGPSRTSTSVIEMSAASNSELQKCVAKLNYVLERQQDEAIRALITNVEAFYRLTQYAEAANEPPPSTEASRPGVSSDFTGAIDDLKTSERRRKKGRTGTD